MFYFLLSLLGSLLAEGAVYQRCRLTLAQIIRVVMSTD